MMYQPLNKSLTEIRVFSFPLDLSPDSSFSTSQPLPVDPICCSLENVSLDAFSPQYQEFLSQAPRAKWDDMFWDLIDSRDYNIMKSIVTNGHTWWSPKAPNDSQIRSFRYCWGDFEALSYSWGESKATCTVIVNGQAIEVSKILEAALRELRSLPETRMGMRYWADALCIDQSNVAEKNHQVKLMKDIYPRARSVIVWLGEGSKTEQKAIDLICQIYEDGFKRQTDPELFSDAGLGHRFGQDSWRALHDFLTMRYWQRLWIIQELALNHDSTLILCGKRRLCRAIVRPALSMCESKSVIIAEIIQPSLSGGDEPREYNIWRAAFRVNRLLELTAETNLWDGLDRILDLIRQSKTSDDKDKVYGLLGIIDPSVSSLVNADYSLSIQAVYKNFATCLIRATSRLDVLFGWTDPILDDPWPSWIPDWRQPYVRNHLQHLKKHYASGSSVVAHTYSIDGNCLTCIGFRVDLIDGTSSAYIGRSTGTYAEPVLQPTQNKNQYGNDLKNAFWQSLRLGVDSFRKPFRDIGRESSVHIPWSVSEDENDEWRSALETPHYERFRHFCEANKAFLICGQQLESFFSHEKNNKQLVEPEKLTNSIQFMALSLIGRRLVTTVDGYLGLAPASAQRGDLIAIVQGCSFPVVLRRDGTRYRLVGECYLHGFMNGEIFAMEMQGRRFIEEFEIV